MMKPGSPGQPDNLAQSCSSVGSYRIWDHSQTGYSRRADCEHLAGYKCLADYIRSAGIGSLDDHNLGYLYTRCFDHQSHSNWLRIQHQGSRLASRMTCYWFGTDLKMSLQ